MRVQVANVTKARTEVVNNSALLTHARYPLTYVILDLNPVWDQIVYIPGNPLLLFNGSLYADPL